MSLFKVQDQDCYSYSEGGFGFLFYPMTGIVNPRNVPSLYRAIEHFARVGMEVNWEKFRPKQLSFMVNSREGVVLDELIEKLAMNSVQLHNASVQKREEEYKVLIKSNIDNNTNSPIKEQYLIDTIGRMNNTTNKTREDVANWFNQFNIEVARPLTPLIKVSTKPKKTIITEGKKLILSLFAKGQLVRYTKVELTAKLEKYTNTSESTYDSKTESGKKETNKT